MDLESIVKNLKKEKDWVSGMLVYSSLKLLECIPTLLYINMHSTQKENNPIARAMMDSLGTNLGLLAQQLIFGSALAVGTYLMNNSKSHLSDIRAGTKFLYISSALTGVLAATNWIQYFSG